MAYDPALSTVVDKLRLALADTDADGVGEWLPDETYEALLLAGGASTTEVDASTAAVARTAAGVIARLIRRRPVKRGANGEPVDYTGQAEAYEAIAAGETPLPLLEVEDTPAPAPNITALIGSRSVATEARF
jgi:hypothetical protein